MGVQGDQGLQGAAILYFSVPAHSLLAFERPVGGNDPSDGVEFAWTTGLMLLVVIFFVVFFLLYVLVLINGERQSAAPQERQDEQQTSQMTDSEPQSRHHVRSGGRPASTANERPDAAGEPG
jgi:cytoskeletal protein RodZ